MIIFIYIRQSPLFIKQAEDFCSKVKVWIDDLIWLSFIQRPAQYITTINAE